MKTRKSNEESGVAISDTSDTDALKELASSPLILYREVEAGLITSLYGMSFREIDKINSGILLASGRNDARYGNGKCSPDFNLFQDSSSIIQKLAEDLTKIMMNAVKSKIFIYDSFFNILGAGGGLVPHNHIGELDEDIGYNLGKKKYSLVYYLSVGDQDCSQPGVLKLYEPNEGILPSKGMIMIFPASRLHSADYGGKTDRVMIGVNFYSLWPSLGWQLRVDRVFKFASFEDDCVGLVKHNIEPVTIQAIEKKKKHRLNESVQYRDWLTHLLHIYY